MLKIASPVIGFKHMLKLLAKEFIPQHIPDFYSTLVHIYNNNSPFSEAIFEIYLGGNSDEITFQIKVDTNKAGFVSWKKKIFGEYKAGSFSEKNSEFALKIINSWLSADKFIGEEVGNLGLKYFLIKDHDWLDLPFILFDLKQFNFFTPFEKITILEDVLLPFKWLKAEKIISLIEDNLTTLSFPSNLNYISLLPKNGLSSIEIGVGPFEVDQLLPYLKKIKWVGSYEELQSFVNQYIWDSDCLNLELKINREELEEKLEIDVVYCEEEKKLNFLKRLCTEGFFDNDSLVNLLRWTGAEECERDGQNFIFDDFSSIEDCFAQNLGQIKIVLEEGVLKIKAGLSVSSTK